MNELELLAREAAGRYGLDPRLICALCEVESAWIPWAVRHEAGYHPLIGFYPATDDRHRIWRDATGQGWWNEINITPETRKYPWECQPLIELLMQQTSWGLLQIMGAVARERGFRDWLTELCDPAVNLEWGCKHLRWMLDHAGSFNIRASTQWQNADLAAAWNGGARIMEFVNAKPTGRYKNQSYVDRVVRAMVNYETGE